MIKSTAQEDNISTESTKPITILKRIGSTTYLVNVHFSHTSKETMEDKLLRLMEQEVNRSA